MFFSHKRDQMKVNNLRRRARHKWARHSARWRRHHKIRNSLVFRRLRIEKRHHWFRRYFLLLALCCCMPVCMPVFMVISMMGGAGDTGKNAIAAKMVSCKRTQQTVTVANSDEASIVAAVAPRAPNATGGGVCTEVACYNAEQVRLANIIIATGKQMNVPIRGLFLAIYVALAESRLKNSANATDHDSVGLFQQRPSQGWGTVAQLTDPVYASKKFYEKLLRTPGWQEMPYYDAALKVQVFANYGASKDNYEEQLEAAEQLFPKLTGIVAIGNNAGQCAVGGIGPVGMGQWTVPVPQGVVSGFRTSDRPSHHGVDLGSGYHVKIQATADGVVIASGCDNDSDCSVQSGRQPDGSLRGMGAGCGWYVKVWHAEYGVTTMYCHMFVKPSVNLRDKVVKGQYLGEVGSTGHSSGAHLHFQIARCPMGSDGNCAGNANAIDPEPYMASKGAPLGGKSV